MTFDWNSVGSAPALDEAEISVFGPGYGECIVIHMGHGKWAVVDSCIESRKKDADSKPVAEKYLRQLGVSIETDVNLIVGTHWHDDHIQGLGRLLEISKNAKFCCSPALTNKEFITYIASLNTGALATDGAKIREFYKILLLLKDRKEIPRYAGGSKRIISSKVNGLGCDVLSLSPSDHEYQIFLQNVASLIPTPNAPKRSAALPSPNLNAIVLHLDFSKFSVLLGSDMEVHSLQSRGWNNVIDEANISGVQKSALYKVAHHGSETGHHSQIWTNLLEINPISVTTPFNRSNKLPTDRDKQRLIGLSRAYLTAPPMARKSKEFEPAVTRSLKESSIEIRTIDTTIGMVRLRQNISNGTDWQVERFGAAAEII